MKTVGSSNHLGNLKQSFLGLLSQREHFDVLPSKWKKKKRNEEGGQGSERFLTVTSEDKQDLNRFQT